jgi:hypothetical protein
MTEKELLDLEFDKITISNSESQNGYDYYFYQKELCDTIVLYTTDSIDAQNDRWVISCWDIPAIKIETVKHYQQFLDVMDNIICE